MQYAKLEGRLFWDDDDEKDLQEIKRYANEFTVLRFRQREL